MPPPIVNAPSIAPTALNGMPRRKRSKATREALSASAREFHRRRLAAEMDAPKPTMKRCARCGHVKPVEEFTHVKRKLKCGVIVVHPHSPCKACKAKAARQERQRLKAEGVYRERQRDYERNEGEKRLRRRREYEAAKRRSEGVPPRHVEAPATRGRRVSIGPLATYLKGRLEHETKGEIAAIAGVSEREITRIVDEEESTRGLASIDRILVSLGCPEKLDELYPLEEPEKLVGYHVLDPDGVLREARQAA